MMLAGAGFGSKSKEDQETDKHQYEFAPNHPSSGGARTSFHAKDAPPAKREKFRRLWRLQHGRGHTWEDWHGNRTRQEDVSTYRRSRAILSQAEVPKYLRKAVADDVLREELQGFSRHYAGMDGATIGFAALREFVSLSEAKESRLTEYADDVLEIDGENLMEYVWRRAGRRTN